MRVRRKQQKWTHPEARRQAVPKAPLGGGNNLADAQPAIFAPEDPGHEVGKCVRLKKSAYCSRPKTCHGSQPNVKNRRAIPLDTVGSMIRDKLHD
jgi:hypothetical protein